MVELSGEIQRPVRLCVVVKAAAAAGETSVSHGRRKPLCSDDQHAAADRDRVSP